MALQFLEFDPSEDALGTMGWDALASPAPTHNAAMLSEVQRLFDLLHTAHGQPGPLDDGHGWDCDLQVQQEDGSLLHWDWHAQRLQWSWTHLPHQRLTLSLCLSGGPAFAHTLEQAIGHA